MTVRITGPWCDHCRTLPAQGNGLCSCCNRHRQLFGTPAEPKQITSVNDPGFEAALRAWREGTA